MAIEAYLELDDVEGESQTEGYENMMRIEDFSWGISQQGTMHDASGGGGAGQVDVQDISISRFVDSASPKIMAGSATAYHYPAGKIHFIKAGGDKLKYLEIELTSILITNVQFGTVGGDDARMMENITLNFAEFTFKYISQDEKGQQKGGEQQCVGNIVTGSYSS